MRNTRINIVLFYVGVLAIITICFVLSIFLITSVKADDTKTISINQDKTYEQCEKKAFEYIYAQVNKALQAK